MTTLTSVLNIARGGIGVSSAGVAVTGENITGANRAGYVRRSALIETRVVGHSIAGGASFMGTERAFDQFSYRNLLRETGNFGSADARSGALMNIEQVVTPADGHTLGDKVASFFTALNDLTQKADDKTARLTVIYRADDVTRGFREMSAGLSNARSEILQQAQAVAGEINVRLEKIATLNKNIEKMQSQPTSGRAEMLDQRDELVREVAERIELTVVPGDDGSITLLSSGSALVDGGSAAQVQVSVDAVNNMKVEFIREGKANDVSSKVNGGRLGGLREARDVDNTALQADLDQFASDFANAVNAVHTAGLDLNGAAGLDIFTDAGGGALPAPPGTAFAMAVNPNIANDTDLIAAASAAAPPPGGNDNAIALAQVSQSVIGAGGTSAETFGALAGNIGARLGSAQSDQQMRESTVMHAENLRQSISGVSLDEEMVNLTKYQRAFEASMRVLRTADELLTMLLQRI